VVLFQHEERSYELVRRTLEMNTLTIFFVSFLFIFLIGFVFNEIILFIMSFKNETGLVCFTTNEHNERLKELIVFLIVEVSLCYIFVLFLAKYV
jgi:hypothetical protein